MPTSSGGPLSDVTVVELGGIGPGAFAGMIMADLGAEVIRVDRPSATAGVFMPPEHDLLNRGKRSIVLDLKRPEGVQAVLALVRHADVLTEGYRPGVAERLGLGPADVWAENQGLVYGRMTGWGQDGPLAQRAGHDVTYIAITGALHAIGDAGVPPQIPLSLVGDFGGGSAYLVMGMLSAVLEARRTGQGQVVDAAIIDGANHLLAAVRALMAAGTWQDERGVNLFDGGCPFYAVYETADGGYMAVGALEPQFYAQLVALLELDEDPARQYDQATWPQLRAKLRTAFLRRTRREWTSIFEGTDACVAPVLSIREAEGHPQMIARRNLVEVDDVVQPAAAPRFSGHSSSVPTPPARPGADTRDVLARIGMETLIDTGVAVEAIAHP